jgi:hypothetical protein
MLVMVSMDNASVKIYHNINLQRGSVCLSLQQVYIWNRKFNKTGSVCIT